MSAVLRAQRLADAGPGPSAGRCWRCWPAGAQAHSHRRAEQRDSVFQQVLRRRGAAPGWSVAANQRGRQRCASDVCAERLLQRCRRRSCRCSSRRGNALDGATPAARFATASLTPCCRAGSPRRREAPLRTRHTRRLHDTTWQAAPSWCRSRSTTTMRKTRKSQRPLRPPELKRSGRSCSLRVRSRQVNRTRSLWRATGRG